MKISFLVQTVLFMSFCDQSICLDSESGNCELIKNDSCSREYQPYITAKWSGLLGNLMFVYAALVGIANRYFSIVCPN
jgi:hypothetical protein